MYLITWVTVMNRTVIWFDIHMIPLLSLGETENKRFSPETRNISKYWYPKFTHDTTVSKIACHYFSCEIVRSLTSAFDLDCTDQNCADVNTGTTIFKSARNFYNRKLLGGEWIYPRRNTFSVIYRLHSHSMTEIGSHVIFPGRTAQISVSCKKLNLEENLLSKMVFARLLVNTFES